MDRRHLWIRILVIIGLTLAGFIFCTTISSNDSNTYAATVVQQGTWGNCDWTFDSDGVVTVSKISGTDGITGTERSAPWHKMGPTKEIRFEPGVYANENSSYLFGVLDQVKSIDLRNLNTGNVVDMSNMFRNDGNLENIEGISNLNVHNVVNMNSVFMGCHALTSLNLDWDTSKVTSMYWFTALDVNLESLNLSHLNTENVTNMQQLVVYDTKLRYLNLSGNFSMKSTDPTWGIGGLFGGRPQAEMEEEYLDSLQVLVLGPNVRLDSTVGMTHPNGSKLWQAVDSKNNGSIIHPAGLTYTPEALVNHYLTAGVPTETYVPEGGIPDISVLTIEPTYSIPAGTKFDPSKVFNSLTTLDGQVITNYQDALKAGLTVSGDQFDTNTAGTHTVTFNYFDKKATTQVTVTSSGGGGGGGNVTPTPTPTPNPEPTPQPQPTPTPTEPTAPSNPSVKPTIPNYAAKKKAAAYAIKGIYLYKHATFNKAQRIAKYPKQKRVNRPMFVVIDYARSNGGALRYKVRDVNHGRKTAGKIGYITANWKFVRPVYYQSMPKNNKIRVISLKGVHAYKNKNLTGRVKSYKKGTRLTVKKIVKHNLTTRYQLKNGLYVTGNKKLIIHDQY